MKNIKHITVIIMIFCMIACNSYQPYKLNKYYGFTAKIEEDEWIEGFKNEVFSPVLEKAIKMIVFF